MLIAALRAGREEEEEEEVEVETAEGEDGEEGGLDEESVDGVVVIVAVSFFSDGTAVGAEESDIEWKRRMDKANSCTGGDEQGQLPPTNGSSGDLAA